MEGRALESGLDHIGFEVEDVRALTPLSDRMGAADDLRKRPPGREAEYRVQDPDGNRIGLSQHGWPV